MPNKKISEIDGQRYAQALSLIRYLPLYKLRLLNSEIESEIIRKKIQEQKRNTE